MTQPDFSDPLHRLENYSKGEFFGAYAILRHAVRLAGSGPEGIRWLRRLTIELDEQLVDRLDVAHTSLDGALTDRGLQAELLNYAKDEGESATG